ncbi:hypothetical protein [Streptomyces sp. MUSC 14]|uniref:hypothetical protein n=1 Tax=Streptomyces sp. MUSC 14 TaxID=1354889 RepID=UPI00210BEF04|nr:hypothetical protein [Streptomyces sp. MUSC 14]
MSGAPRTAATEDRARTEAAQHPSAVRPFGVQAGEAHGEGGGDAVLEVGQDMSTPGQAAQRAGRLVGGPPQDPAP